MEEKTAKNVKNSKSKKRNRQKLESALRDNLLRRKPPKNPKNS